jgi:hypothetical protein
MESVGIFGQFTIIWSLEQGQFYGGADDNSKKNI